MARWSVRAVILISLGALAACVYGPLRSAPAPQPAALGTEPDGISALYAETSSAIGAAEQALELWRSGDGAASRAKFATARARLRTSAERCASLNGCELSRVLAAQERLLALQAQALTKALVAPASGLAAAHHAGDSDDGTGASPLLTDLPESARSVNLLKGRDLRELIAVDDTLRAALREWLTWMRPQLLDAYEHYQYMRHRMWPAYAEAGLPEAMLFGILAKESGGRVHAVSSAGASGPLQFMPATGLRYGLGVKDGFDLRFDPAAATAANVAYLNDQFARFNNNLELALGAYNGGEGRMARLSPKGSRRFWDPRVFQHLPSETRAYVPMVLAAAWLFLHPEEYGLRWPAVDPRPGAIELVAGLSLNELAICLGQEGNQRGWFRTLRNLNPRWDPNERLPAGTRLELPARAAAAYQAQCTASDKVAELHAMQAARIPGVSSAPLLAGSVRTHVVGKGETLSVIARKLGCNGIKALADANRIAPPRYAIRAGQKLRVPDCRA